MKACIGDETTYTTACAARMDDYTVFQGVLQGFPLREPLEGVSYRIHNVLRRRRGRTDICLLLMLCRMGSYTAFLFFPDQLGGSSGSP